MTTLGAKRGTLFPTVQKNNGVRAESVAFHQRPSECPSVPHPVQRSSPTTLRLRTASDSVFFVATLATDPRRRLRRGGRPGHANAVPYQGHVSRRGCVRCPLRCHHEVLQRRLATLDTTTSAETILQRPFELERLRPRPKPADGGVHAPGPSALRPACTPHQLSVVLPQPSGDVHRRTHVAPARVGSGLQPVDPIATARDTRICRQFCDLGHVTLNRPVRLTAILHMRILFFCLLSNRSTQTPIFGGCTTDTFPTGTCYTSRRPGGRTNASFRPSQQDTQRS
jgi:hypothetical protein